MKEWLKNSEKALKRALEILDNGDLPPQNLYVLAPLVYSEMNNTNNESLLNQMSEENDYQVKDDWSYNPKSKDQYKFHFISSYLFGYVVFDKIDEFKYDRIMNYVTQEMDLFTSDYGH
ncbi:MAG: hypothetical protein QGG88_12140 [Gammaproteobacteria bacterium]|jgi:hypothetical protein|nr:hypothetical protein [Gammaproteobacteria bacterium]